MRRAARVAQGRRPSLRFRVPSGRRVEFEDLVHGAQSFLSDDIGDFIIRREDGAAAFFFSNALDDALMQVSHVLRGEDHLSNTPRQRLLLEALELPPPQYGHVSLLIGEDGTPLSKRHGATGVRELREAGYVEPAVCNHLFRLGAFDADESDAVACRRWPRLRPQASAARAGAFRNARSCDTGRANGCTG